MITFEKMLHDIADSINVATQNTSNRDEAPMCYEHLRDQPCSICAEDEHRGYQVRILAGRCANGAELGSGTQWHAVKPGEHKAICGATPGRRSVGWSSWRKIGQEVTCPKCRKKLQQSKTVPLLMAT